MWRFARLDPSATAGPAFVLARVPELAPTSVTPAVPIAVVLDLAIGSSCVAPLVAEQARGRRPAGRSRSHLAPDVGSCPAGPTGWRRAASRPSSKLSLVGHEILTAGFPGGRVVAGPR